MLDGGQSSQDQSKQPTSRGREVSNVVGDLGSLLILDKSTWQKSCKKNIKRKQEVLVMAEELTNQRKVDEDTRSIIMRGLKRLHKTGEEEEEEVAKEWLESEELHDSKCNT